MRMTTRALLAGVAVAAAGTAAHAQFPFDFGYGGAPAGPDTAILFEYPNFQGRSIVVNRENGNLDGSGFNDRARSVQLTGNWRLCEDADYRGRCMNFSGPVADLNRAGIRGLSSLQVTGGYGGYPGSPGYPSYPGGYGYPGQAYGPVQGREVVFYPGPVNGAYGGGYYGSSAARSSANAFCRSVGHANAVYYDRVSGVLSDVLCRR